MALKATACPVLYLINIKANSSCIAYGYQGTGGIIKTFTQKTKKITKQKSSGTWLDFYAKFGPKHISVLHCLILAHI